jgi:hypothetical protein
MHFEDSRIVGSLKTKGYKLTSKEMVDIDIVFYYRHFFGIGHE